MLIAPKNDDAAFVRQIDAQSRVAVWAANHVNSPMISKLGLTHVLDGAADASGKIILHASGPGLTLERRDAVMPQGQIPYYQGGMLSTTALVPQGQIPYQGGMLSPVSLAPQQIGYVPVSFEIPQLSPVPPHAITQTISEMTEGCDPVYIAEELGLFQRDMDKVSGPKLCRCFCESNHFIDGFNLACLNVDGSFKVRFALLGNSVFDAKFFKYNDSPEVNYFLFAPRVSAVYVPPDCTGVFVTDANLLLSNLSSNMGWLCTAGGVETLDWEIIRRFGKAARLVWSVFPDDALLTRNLFAEAFAIVTEAKRHGVEMNILQATAIAINPMSQVFNRVEWDAQESLLDDREIKKLARKYGLEIDPIWNGLPGEIDFDDEPLVSSVPPFWKGNRIAMFVGEKSVEFMKELVTRRIWSWLDCKRVLVVVDEKDRNLAQQVHAAGGDKMRIALFDVLKDKHIFLQNVPSLVDMIFIVPPYGDSEMKAVTPEILDVCTQTGLPVGIFSRSPDAPRQEIALDMVCYCVAKSKPAENLFSVKNMDNDTIVNYKFFPAGVEETPGTKEDMREGE